MKTDFLSCIIYNDNGWKIADSAGHTQHNVAGVSVVNGNIVISFKPMDVRNVLNFSVSNDEEMALAGVMAGASVGFTQATIKIARLVNGAMQQVDANNLNVANGNFFVSGLFEIY